MPSLQRLGDLVREMVHKALGAFAGMDVNMALEVERADIEADGEYQKVMRDLTTQMTRGPAQRRLGAASGVGRARARARRRSREEHLRIPDLLVQGKDVRHVSIEDRERQVQSRSSGIDLPD